MECPLCGHAETLVYGKTDQGELQRICPACHEIFADRPHYTALWINLLRFRVLAQPEIKSPETKSPEVKSVSWSNLFDDAGIVTTFTLAQCGWMSAFTSPKVGLINLLPTFIFLATWYLFAKTQLNQKLFSIDLQKYAWLAFSLGFILTLRLPLTISRNLELVNWGIYSIVFSLILSKIVSYFKQERKLGIMIAAIAIILFNSFTHISLNSPYTYAFRSINNLASNYSKNADNNSTWECPYDRSDIAVNCDMRHFIASEKIFTQPKYDASFSVLLQRFFYGYLSSLIGYDGHRWIASFSVNLILWIFACTALYKACILLGIDKTVASISMLCCATSFGFTYFVGQPSPHIASYAYASISIWVTVEILLGSLKNYRETALFSLVIISAGLCYEIYPLTLACFITLFAFNKRCLAVLIILIQFLLSYIWRKICLEQLLGTAGNIDALSNGSKILTYNLQIWTNTIHQMDFTSGLQFVLAGIKSYSYASFIIGVPATLACILYLLIGRKTQLVPNRTLDKNKLLLIISLSFCTLMLLSMAFIAPQTKIFSPTGIQPRLSFFIYPINIVALALILNTLIKKYAYVLVLLTFFVSNLDLTGMISIQMFFDFGTTGMYWK